MPDAVGSLARHAAAAACLVLSLATSAAAQMPAPAPGPANAAASPDVLTRYAFHLAGARMFVDDDRFSWDTHFGGDVDVVDYGVGRVNLLADYNAVLGDQFRPFDPIQGNYTLEASVSARAAGAEFAGVFHHLSRHLGDRYKRFGVDWNAVEVRALKRIEVAGWTFDGQAAAGPVVKHDYVDYIWTANADAKASRPLNSRVGVFAVAGFEVFGVDTALADRGAQRGGHFEAGLRVNGAAGALELFAGVEQRVDAYQLDRVPQRWALAGFRIVNK